MIASVCSQRFSKYSLNCMSTQRAILTKCILIDLSIARSEYKMSWSGIIEDVSLQANAITHSTASEEVGCTVHLLKYLPKPRGYNTTIDI